MAARMCPQCMKSVPARCAAAFSDGMSCQHCQARLEVALGSRGVATFAGLFAGCVAWWASQGTGGSLAAVLPVLYAILAFGIVSAAVVMFTADLLPAAAIPEPAPAASHGHGGDHH